MAGDWIKVRHCLWSHPRVVTLSSRLSATRAQTLGALCRAWCIADLHAEDDGTLFMSAEALDSLTETPGLSAAMVHVGWLRILSEESVQFVSYQEHNGPTAKARAANAKRQKLSRESRNGNVAPGRDKSATREEKRREEYKNPPKPPQGGAASNNAAPTNGTHKTARPRASRRSATPTQDAIDRVFPVGGDA